jgi:hypothetical protein
VELAICLPVLVLVLTACLAGIACLTTQLRCVDVAREAALLVARGVSAAEAERSVRTSFPGARVFSSSSDDLIRVEVRAPPIALLGIQVKAEAIAVKEP